MDVRSLTIFSASCEDLDGRFEEELEEESPEHLLFVSVLCSSILEADTLGFMQCCRTIVNSVADSTTGHPSGWIMPLRI